MKRYLRIDFVYNTEDAFAADRSNFYFVITEKVGKILEKEMPYLKVLRAKDIPDETELANW